MTKHTFQDLIDVMAKLRSPGGCKWDLEQTNKTLRPYIIEEAYEVIEAIDDGSMNKLREELGDLLLQIVFHSQLTKEEGAFDITDVIHEVTEKMIRRHPHVFGDLNVVSSREVIENWEKIKSKEKQHAKRDSHINFPKGMPALALAQKIQGQAARVGFDWPDVGGALEKVIEELEEFFDAWHKGDTIEREKEFGDILFAIVNLARFLDIEAEAALASTNRKFVERFRFIEKRVAERGMNFDELTLEEMDRIWDEAKENFKKKKENKGF